MCSESQSAYEDFLEINKDSNEPCIKAVTEALKDHNENCKAANSKNKEIIIADFLIKEWDNLLNDYRRALGGKKPDNEDPIPLKTGEDKRGYLGGPEWGGLSENGSIVTGGGFAICNQPIKYNRGVNPSSGKPLELCDWWRVDECDAGDNFIKDHTSHFECRHGFGLKCLTNPGFNASAVAAGYANLGTEMCFLQGMPVGNYYDNPQPPPAIGHSIGYRNFIRERCGKDGCSPKKPSSGDISCDVVPGYTTKYWKSQLLECGYNKVGVDKRLLEFENTRLGRGKFLDRISENSNKIRGTGDNIITEDDILDYYISKLNSKFPNAKLTKENIRENTGPIKNAAGFPAEGVVEETPPWNPNPKQINEILVDAGRSEQIDKLVLPNCCSNTINLGDGSRAMLSDINQSCSIQSNEEDNTEQNNIGGGSGGPVDPTTPPPTTPPPTTPPNNDDKEDTFWDKIGNWFKDENNLPIIGVGGLLLFLVLFLIFR